MSEMYRICHNCGASLTAGETYCPRCGAKYIEPIVQKPREFEPFPPDQSAASEQTEPQVAQQPVVLPPPPQMRSAPSPYAANRYGQQPPVRPGPGQVGGPPQPPNGDSGTGMRILTVTYTATLHVLPNGPGGTVQFMYTVDGGRTTKPGFVQFSPGATTMKYPFTSSGVLAQNGAFPGSGQVTTTSPNVISSQTVVPGGSCTPVTPTP